MCEGRELRAPRLVFGGVTVRQEVGGDLGFSNQIDAPAQGLTRCEQVEHMCAQITGVAYKKKKVCSRVPPGLLQFRHSP